MKIQGLSEDNKINKSQTSRKASMSVELSPRKVNEPPVQQVQSLAEDVDSNVRSTGTDTPYLTSLLHPGKIFAYVMLYDTAYVMQIFSQNPFKYNN